MCIEERHLTNNRRHERSAIIKKAIQNIKLVAPVTAASEHPKHIRTADVDTHINETNNRSMELRVSISTRTLFRQVTLQV